MQATNAVCIETDEYLPNFFPEVSLVSIWGGWLILRIDSISIEVL